VSDIARGAIVAVFVIAAVIVGVLTEAGCFEYVAGGECGGASCINSGHWKGFRLVFVLLVAAVFVGSWPRVVQRYRYAWGDT
jgi:hypothetical protein